jgi:hypothetical protein
MSDDIRLSLGFWNHPKTKKLQKHLGLEAIRSLQILWLWAAQNKPTGVLYAMSAEDVELASDWNGVDGEFSTALVALGWLEFQNETYIIHDWGVHQPWLIGAESRKKKATCAAQARWNRDDKNAKGMPQECSEHTSGTGLAMPVSLPFPPLPEENIPPTPKTEQEGNEQPKPAKQPQPKRTYLDHRPKDCALEKWKQLFAYSWRFHKDRAKMLGARAPFGMKKVLDGAKTLDNMTRVRGIASGQIIAAMEWVVKDRFWNDRVRALSSLTKIGGNGDTKFANILTAMARDLVP